MVPWGDGPVLPEEVLPEADLRERNRLEGALLEMIRPEAGPLAAGFLGMAHREASLLAAGLLGMPRLETVLR